MQPQDFDRWRAEYDQMTYADQVAFYNQVAEDHPHQVHFDASAFERFLRWAIDARGCIGVIEVGGWKGELAQAMLARLPDVLVWINYEISQTAAEQSVIESNRYQVVVPDDFAWNITLAPADVMVASHTIEHIRERDLAALVDNLPPVVKFVGLQAPLADSAQNVSWAGYWGSHILEIGWYEVVQMLAERGFELIDDLTVGEFRAFRRAR
jgi:hypothetical protein